MMPPALLPSGNNESSEETPVSFSRCTYTSNLSLRYVCDSQNATCTAWRKKKEVLIPPRYAQIYMEEVEKEARVNRLKVKENIKEEKRQDAAKKTYINDERAWRNGGACIYTSCLCVQGIARSEIGERERERKEREKIYLSRLESSIIQLTSKPVRGDVRRSGCWP